MPDVTARTTVLAALAKLAPPPADGDTVSAQTAVLPSARAARTVDLLADAGTLDGLKQRRPDMRAVIESLLNWHGTRATKPTMKAAGRALTAVGDDGNELYPQAVEMLSFVAACAPLLQPDRLARLMAAAADTPCAYQPIFFPARLTAALTEAIGHYTEERQEALLISLWEAAHDGRWWDHTAGFGRRRRRRRADTDGDGGEAGGPAVEIDAATVVGTLLDERLAWRDDAVALLRTVPLPAGQRRQLSQLARADLADPDTAVLLAQIPSLLPNERPANPVVTMVDTLVYLRREAEAAGTLAEITVAKPKSWAELYPRASLLPFDVPENVLDALHWTLLGPADTPLRTEVVRNANELYLNKTFMGNCSYGYKSRCASGDVVFLRVHLDGELYNATLRRQGSSWTLGEVNSRHNGGGVPEVVRVTLAAAAARL